VDLSERSLWIFDMDGTLTRSVHDFQTIRSTLGLADGAPILESIEVMGDTERTAALEEVAAWERGLVARAAAQPRARELLARLQSRGARLGILTRNLRSLAHLTLAEAGLSEYFARTDVLGRDSAAPKPSPEGILLLLEQWAGTADQAVMVGDYVFDAQAGRAAGVATVLLDPARRPEWEGFADLVLDELGDLLDHVIA
jgi:HAD superfamily hydrolase (TIGR01549 family)